MFVIENSYFKKNPFFFFFQIWLFDKRFILLYSACTGKIEENRTL